MIADVVALIQVRLVMDGKARDLAGLTHMTAPVEGRHPVARVGSPQIPGAVLLEEVPYLTQGHPGEVQLVVPEAWVVQKVHPILPCNSPLVGQTITGKVK